MLRYVLVSLGSGITFGLLDAVIHANPLAQRLYQVYKPISRASVNAPLGVGIDLMYGFSMAALFLLLYPSLPGHNGILKGISFGLIAWFFRVVMSAAAAWVMFKVPGQTLVYDLLTGLGEVVAIGMLYGWLLVRPGGGH